MVTKKAELTPPQREAILAYAEANGRSWKARLSADWMRAAANVRGEYRAELQQVRNCLGPRWLHRVSLDELKK